MKSNKVLVRMSNSCIVAIMVTSLTLSQIPLASGDPLPINSSTGLPGQSEEFQPQIKDTDNNPHASPYKFDRYVKDKYKQINRAESDVKPTAHGPSGTVFIVGDIVPHRKPAIDLTAEPDRHVRARAIACAFMEDEPALLGINNPEEIREVEIKTSKGYNGDNTDIYYKRYINNVELESAHLLITIGNSENITSILAWLVSVPPEVYEATNKKTLSEKEIRSIVEADISEQVKRDLDMNNVNKSFKKVAITKDPYILWKVSYVYDYTIDAFTGKILTKESGIIPPFKFNSHQQ